MKGFVKTDICKNTFTKNGEIVSRKIAGELFLIPIRGKLSDMKNIFTLNAVGEFIWQTLDSPKSFRDICDGVVSSFQVAKEQAESDVSDFINELLETGLIRVQ